MAKKNPLGAALGIILGSSVITTIVTVLAAAITGEVLYYVAAGLFATSGIVGVVVIGKLSKKISGK